MAEVGKTSTLTVVSKLDFGIYLDGGELGEILLPGRYIPKDSAVGDEIEVFIYTDSEDRVIATTEIPYVEADQFASLKVIDIGSYGAFLDWGLPKDLLVPHREMAREMEVGRSYVVYVYRDEESNRMVATARLDRYLSSDTSEYAEGDEVEILVVLYSDLGCKVIVNDHCWGMVYTNEIFKELRKGDRLIGYIKKLREDGKLDIALQKPGYESIDPVADQIHEMLVEEGGYLPYTDKSEPDDIYDTFGVSKKVFKKAIGALYRKKVITIENDGIRLV